MLRTLMVLTQAQSAITQADALERRYGRWGRLRLLMIMPVQMLSISLAASLVTRALAPLRQLTGRPVHPASAAVATAWTSLLIERGVLLPAGLAPSAATVG